MAVRRGVPAAEGAYDAVVYKAHYPEPCAICAFRACALHALAQIQQRIAARVQSSCALVHNAHIYWASCCLARVQLKEIYLAVHRWVYHFRKAVLGLKLLRNAQQCSGFAVPLYYYGHACPARACPYAVRATVKLAYALFPRRGKLPAQRVHTAVCKGGAEIVSAVGYNALQIAVFIAAAKVYVLFPRICGRLIAPHKYFRMEAYLAQCVRTLLGHGQRCVKLWRWRRLRRGRRLCRIFAELRRWRCAAVRRHLARK